MKNRHSLPRITFTIAIVWLAPLAACGKTSGDLAVRLGRIAEELPWLNTGDVIYDREPQSGPDPRQVVAALRELEHVYAGNARSARPTTSPATTTAAVYPLVLAPARGLGPDEVRPLLRHANPKVRTLAVVLLLKMERLDVMPDVAALVDDGAETFAAPQMMAGMDVLPTKWPMQTATVRDYARVAVDQYVGASAQLEDLRRNGRIPRDGTSLARVFREMAATRDPFTNTATLRVAMQRATGRTSPLPGERVNRVLNVLMRIHRLPMPRRFFVAHALDAHRLCGERYSPTFLLDLAREVPREVRIAVLNGARPADDPDLEPGTGWRYIVGNAVHLLRAQDVELLLRLDAEHVARNKKEGSAGYANALYRIGAARLAPARAEAILIPALDGRSVRGAYGEDANAAAALLAELGDENGINQALNWFFVQKPEPGSYGGGREAILSQLQVSHPARFRQFVARVIRDDRLTTLGPASTRMLVRAVQGYSGIPVVDEDQIRDSYGVDEARRDRRPTYLPDWHRRLRDTIGEWNTPR